MPRTRGSFKRSSSKIGFAGSRNRRVTKYARGRCPSTILDGHSNRIRIECGGEPRSRTAAGQRDLAARLAQVLEATAACEAAYAGRPPPSATKEAIHASDAYRDFTLEFCRQAPDRSGQFAALAASARARHAEMAAEAGVLVEIERRYYRLDMDLPDPRVAPRATPQDGAPGRADFNQCD
jgi:hypothetical protein